MVKAAKFLVLLGAILGVAAFFLPFVQVVHRDNELSVSAFQATKGVQVLEENIEGSPESEETRELDDILTKVKGFLIGVYGPSVLLLLFSVIGAVRRKYGRPFALMSFLLGGITLAAWGLIAGVASDSEVGLGLGVHLLAATGSLALLGGLINTVKPDRG